MSLPIFKNAALKVFEDGEIHVTRCADFHVFIIMLDGCLEFIEDGKHIKLSAGDYYIQRAGLYQKGTVPCGGARYYYVHFCGDIPCPIKGHGDFTKLVPQLERLEYLSLTNADTFTKTTVFYNILHALTPPAFEGDKTVSLVLRTVLSDLSRRYTLDDIAGICGYSKNHVINVFKRKTGSSPLAYIANIRHTRAKELLDHSTLPIAVIAAQTGYSDYINFYKDFKAREGIAPTEYRKK